MEKEPFNKLYINLSAIAENYSIIKNFVGDKIECTANIRANAYGLGVMPIMRCLSASGCNKFFVTNLEEAIELRNFLSITDEIYVLNGIAAGEEPEFTQYNIIPVISNKGQFQIFNNYCRRKNKNFDAVLNINTGVNRFGFSANEVIELANEDFFKQKVRITFLMSQLAYSNEIDQTQLKLVHQLKEIFQVPVSFADSNGICLGPDYHFDIIRLGIILYGCAPDEFNLKKAISLSSSIIQIKETHEDIYVGHNNSIKVKKNTILATIPIGYADGLHASIKNDAIFYINDRPVKIVGDISMDMITLDVTDIPKYDLMLGAEVEILGRNVSIEQMAKWAGVTRHNILTSLSHRLQRIYI
jgi:alanine racemase